MLFLFNNVLSMRSVRLSLKGDLNFRANSAFELRISLKYFSSKYSGDHIPSRHLIKRR